MAEHIIFANLSVATLASGNAAGDCVVLPAPIAFKIVLILALLSLGLTTETSVGLNITGITTGLP
ncbi:hypothetical protein B0H14DRAFT_3477086 [Mycena olivaceomarginata]|nr:hypothetical protein B0H14DRAFT_3477086 [Mycena olivaceomarginata]